MKCKQGEMAFIKKALRTENIGRVVTCKEMLGYFIQWEDLMYNGERWLAQDTDYIWVVQGNLETQYGAAKEALIPDSWLQPIRPDGLDSDEDTTVKKSDTIDA